MGTYGISPEEFLDGHLHLAEEDERYGFEQFLTDFEGDVSARTVADAFNKLAVKYKWNDRLRAIENND